MQVDLEKLRMGNAPVAPVYPRRAKARRFEGRFVKGPIAWDWLARAAALPGRALHVAMLIAYRQGIERSDVVRIPPSDAAEFDVARHSMYRALDALERAHLITVERHRGRGARITVLAIVPKAAT